MTSTIQYCKDMLNFNKPYILHNYSNLEVIHENNKTYLKVNSIFSKDIPVNERWYYNIKSLPKNTFIHAMKSILDTVDYYHFKDYIKNKECYDYYQFDWLPYKIGECKIVPTQFNYRQAIIETYNEFNKYYEEQAICFKNNGYPFTWYMIFSKKS